MRRVLVLALSALLVAGCAGQAPPLRDPLPDVAQVVPEPQSCAFQIGEGRGVSIDDVIADSGADGALSVGDLLVAVNSQPIANADQLRAALGDQQIGDRITVEVIRDGEEISTEIVLGPNPDVPDRPMLGVMIVTDFERVDPTEVAAGIVEGNLARAVGIGSSVYLLDPISGEWAALGVEVPTVPWVAAGRSVLTLESPATADSALVDADSGDRLVFDIGELSAVALLGQQGSDTVVSAARVVSDGTQMTDLAVVAIDFDGRVVEWIWQINQEIGVPVAAFPSPDKTRVLIAGQSQEDELVRYTIISNDGLPIASPETLNAAEGAAALGWFDDESFLVATGEAQLLIIDAATGVDTEASMPAAVGTVTRVATVGDGVHVLAESGTSLLKLDLGGTTEIRTLADHCQIGVIGNLGWSA